MSDPEDLAGDGPGTPPEPGAPSVESVVLWEASAADGRLEELIAWVAAAAPHAPLYRSAQPPGGRVVAVLDAGQQLAPPPELAARPPHAWPFDRLR